MSSLGVYQYCIDWYDVITLGLTIARAVLGIQVARFPFGIARLGAVVACHGVLDLVHEIVHG